MEKLPELPQGIATRAKGYTFDQFEKDVEKGISAIVEHIKELETQHNKDRWQLEIETRLASVEERLNGVCLAQTLMFEDKEKIEKKLLAQEFIIKALKIHIHELDNGKLNDTNPPICPTCHKYECICKAPAPPTEGEALWNAGYRKGAQEMQVRAEAAKARLQEAVLKAEGWYKFYQGAMPQRAINEIIKWLAMYGDKGGEK